MTVVINGSTGISGADGSVGTPAFQGTDTNTGVYFPGANRLGFATDGTQRGEFDASGNFQFNSGYGSVATAYGCRAWVNFNGTGTVAIRASGNVSSITDNGTGDYTVNFTTAMPDANYAPLATIFLSSNTQGWATSTSVINSSSFKITTPPYGGATNTDSSEVKAAVFR
jgi:hypothetical protein